MSFSKAHLFPEPDQATAKLARAIGHPARIGILRLMAELGEVESKRLCNALPLSHPTIQQHLKYLHERNIILVDTIPKKAKYQVNWSGFNDLKLILGKCLMDVDPKY